MPLQKKKSGTAGEKRNCWSRGQGAYSYRGELKRGIKLNKKRLNRSIRYNIMEIPGHSDYKKATPTNSMVKFS